MLHRNLYLQKVCQTMMKFSSFECSHMRHPQEFLNVNLAPETHDLIDFIRKFPIDKGILFSMLFKSPKILYHIYLVSFWSMYLKASVLLCWSSLLLRGQSWLPISHLETSPAKKSLHIDGFIYFSFLSWSLVLISLNLAAIWFLC